MKKRVLSVLFIIALLVTALLIPAQAADPDPDGNGCPHCTGTVTWTQWSGTAGSIAAGGHYKLTAKAKTGYLDVNGFDIVIDVNGFNLYNDPGASGRGATSRVLRVTNGGSVTVIDSSGTNTGAISGTATLNGSAAFINNGTVNLYGGIIKCNSVNYSNASGGTVYINNSGKLNMYGGEIRATTLTGGSGGAIYTGSANAQINISGGKVTGGTVSGEGAAIYAAGHLTIGGTANLPATVDSNVFLTGTATLTLEGAPTVGGLNIPSADTTVKINTLSDGAKIGLATAPVVLSEANPNLKSYVEAGYLYAHDTSLALSVAEDNKTISAGVPVIDCPHCDTDPADIQWVEWEKQTESGHYYIAAGTSTTQYVTEADTDIVLDLRGNWYTAGSNRAFVVKNGATFSLINTEDTASAVSSGHSSGPVEVQANSTFKLYPGITCKQNNSANTMAITAKGGTVIFADGVNMATLSGKIKNVQGMLEGIEGALLMAQNTVDGGVWYQTAQEAADNFVDADHDFIRLMGEATVKVEEPNVRFNINGYNLTVDPATTQPIQTLNFTSSVTAANEATVTADAEDLQMVVPYTKKVQYVALSNGQGAYTLHRLELQLSYVTFRPAAFGFYYKATFNTDDVLAEQVTGYGVALSLAGVPDASVSTKTEMTDFAAARGTDVKFGGLFGIMKESNSAQVNVENGMTKVYANCYVKIGDLVVLADNGNVGKKAGDEGFSGVGKSLFDVMQSLNTMTLEGEQLAAVEQFKTDLTKMGVAWPEAGDTTLNTIPLA